VKLKICRCVVSWGCVTLRNVNRNLGGWGESKVVARGWGSYKSFRGWGGGVVFNLRVKGFVVWECGRVSWWETLGKDSITKQFKGGRGCGGSS